jgi:hypothetical protein
MDSLQNLIKYGQSYWLDNLGSVRRFLHFPIPLSISLKYLTECAVIFRTAQG